MNETRLEEYLRKPETYEEFKYRMNKQTEPTQIHNSCVWPIYVDENDFVKQGQELPPKDTNTTAVIQRL